MSNKILERFNTLAAESFTEYRRAENALTEAKKKAERNPVRGAKTPQEQFKAQKAQIELREAEEAFKQAKRSFEGKTKEVDALRDELLEQIRQEVAVDPAKLDRNVVTVLHSGICTVPEIETLYQKADSPTMKRYIGKFAKEEAARIHDRMMDESKKHDLETRLNYLAAQGQAAGDADNNTTVQAFDVMRDCFTRCTRNPAMIGYWDELTGRARETE